MSRVFFVDMADCLSGSSGISFHQVLDQQRNVILPLAQRWNTDRKDVQPVEKILAECTGMHGRIEVPIGRGNHTDIDRNWLVTPNPLQFSFLENAQQSKLRLGRKFADLVKENRPAIGGLEPSRASLKCPGKGTFFMAEKLGGDERRRNGRAIDANECFRRALGPLMNGTGNQFFSRAGLTQNQYRGIGRCHFVNLREHLAKRLRRPDNCFVHRGTINLFA